MWEDSDVRTSKILRGVAIVLGIAVVLWALDSMVAARAEHRLASSVRANAKLDVSPAVFLGGMPYLGALISGEVNQVSVTVSDVESKDFGLITANANAADVELGPRQIFQGEVAGATAQILSQTIGLDAVAIGRQLNIADLDLSNPYDISPAGTNVSEVQLRGTPRGADKPVTVRADLRLEGPNFRLTPTEVVDSGDGSLDEEAIKRAFQWRFDTRTLPMNAQATYVYLSGGTIYFQTQERNVTLSLEDFSPIRSTDHAIIKEDS